MAKPQFSLAENSFGDLSLRNGALAPLATDARHVGWRRSIAYGAMLMLLPDVYQLAGAALSPLATAVIAWVVIWPVLALCRRLARTPSRYGVGYAIALRAAFGTRGALFFQALRWIFGAMWAAFWALQFAQWIFLLVRATAVAKNSVGWLPLAAQQPLFLWAVAMTLLLTAARFADEHGKRVTRLVPWMFLVVLLSGAALVWLAAGVCPDCDFLAPPFNREVWRYGVPGVRWGGALAIMVVAHFICNADWLRLRSHDAQAATRPFRRRFLLAMAPLLAAGVGAALAAVGAALAQASHLLRGRSDAVAIADGAGFGGILGGIIGTIFCLALWFASAPTCGFFSPSLCCCALWPRLVTFARGRALTVLASTAAVAVFLRLGEQTAGNLLMFTASAVAVPLGVLCADELIARRGRLALEELYSVRSGYGPVYGYSPAGWIAALLGYAVQACCWWGGASQLVSSASLRTSRWAAAAISDIAIFGLSALTAALAYWFLSPLQQMVTAELGKSKGG